jgi:RNA polymerase sigma-70 factor (ECF subfamily)
MPDRPSIASLARRLAAGDPGAADVVFDRFVGRLVGLARARLDPRLAARVDPEDVVQSALRSFLVRCRDGRLELADPDRLWALLATLTVRKCHRQAEAHFADKRDVRRESAPDEEGATGEPDWGLTREPTPEEAACLGEVVQEVMARLATPLKRRVFELSLQGCSAAEIAAELNYYERGVERIRTEVKAALIELAEG